MAHFKIATYNTHKSRGVDGRVRPERICDVLREMDPDIVALQEVVNISGSLREKDQGRYFAEELGFHYRVGETRKIKGHAYGNVILSRIPFQHSVNVDLSVRRYEHRGCIRGDFELENQLIHVFNVHLGVDYFERRGQGRKLIGDDVLHHTSLKGPRIVLGDFNEWTLGITTRLLIKHLKSVAPSSSKRRVKTFPGLLPMLPLDHIYFEAPLELKKFRIHRTALSKIASDHLPMIAEFELNPPKDRKTRDS